MEAMVINDTLPSELIIDIFLKLPVKSLCRFRCLSKSCQSLISSSWFIKTHLTTTKNQRLVRSYYGLRCLDLEKSSDDHHKFVKLKLNFLEKTFPSLSYKSMLIYGSCNGLLCLSRIVGHEQFFFIYNPATRECKLLPEVVEPCCSTLFIDRGFGYVSSIDDYMFVQVSWSGKEANIFSLKNNLWKRVKVGCCSSCANFATFWSSVGIPLEGAIHWALRNVENKSYAIAAFDLVEEKFKILTEPNNNIPRDKYSSMVGVMGDCLCMSYWSYDGSSYEFWIMKEYGIEESWSRIILVSGNSPYRKITQPLCLRKNTDTILMVLNGKELVIYDKKAASFKDFLVDGLKPNLLVDELTLQVYVESLVSPNYNTD